MTHTRNLQQIIRLDGKDCFVEVMNNAFHIGKVLLNFIQYNDSNEKGSRVMSQIPIYMDISQFLLFSNDILSGKMAKLAEIEKAKGNKYPASIYTEMGGTSAEALEKRGKSRPDGMSVSRQLKLIPGKVKPFLLQAELGKGEQNDKGLIVPRYGTKPEQKVMIPLEGDDLKKLCLITTTNINAYFASLYVSGEAFKSNYQQTQDTGVQKQA